MTSMFEHTKSRICVHILHDGTLTSGNRSLLAETAETFGQRIEFYDVTACLEQMGSSAIHLVQNRLSRLSVGSLFRLLIPDIIPLDKVIYLDCDIVVNLDIGELWKLAPDDFSLAGALDSIVGARYRGFSSKAFNLKLMGCDWKTYVNSGVLLMNLKRIREKFNLVEQCLLWFKRYEHLSNSSDQDFINYLFHGDIKIIDGKFNSYRRHGDLSDSVLHAIASPKPWNGLEGSSLDRLYWKTYLKTPWGRFSQDDLIDILLDTVRDSPLTHRRTKQCYETVLRRFRKDVLRNSVFASLWILAKELRYKAQAFFSRGERR